MDKKLEALENSVARFYERYSAKRVALATFLVGFFSLLAALGVYSWLNSGLFAALAGLLFGFIGINTAFLAIVPPAKSLAKSKHLICGALKEPARIKSYSMEKVQLADGEGKLHTLSSREQGLWKSLVVPYLIECQASGNEPDRRQSKRTLTASERRYIEERRKEVLEMEKKIEDERKSLDKDRSELEARSADLKQAEELVIARLSGVEQAEAEIEQLRIVAAERADEDAAAYDAKAAEAKAAELQAKESELAELKERLAKDRQNLESQKAEMQRLKESATRTPFKAVKNAGSTSGQSLEDREAALEARSKQLEEEAEALEKRSTFVTDSENSLIERLDALSHREANVEQSEVDAGLRKD